MTDVVQAGRKRVLGLTLLLIAAIFVLQLALQLALTKPYGSYNASYYDELADAFLRGQTALLRAPPPGLLALADPWDPAANDVFRDPPGGPFDLAKLPDHRFPGVHDLTLYDGKLYMQWGPLPALALIPLRWLLGHDLPIGQVTVVAAALAGLANAASILLLLRRSGLPPTRLLAIITILHCLLSPSWTYLLRRIAVYEIGVFFAQLCLSLAVLSFVRAFDMSAERQRTGVLLLLSGSLFLGFAVDCRPNLAPLGLMLPILLVLWFAGSAQQVSPGRVVGAALAIGSPAAFCLLATLAYNDARFGDWFETGQTWQLWGGDQSMWRHQFQYLDVARILPNVVYYFLAPVSFAAAPLLKAQLMPPASWLSGATLAAYDHYADPTVGLFAITPITILALFWPLLFLRGRYGSVGRGRALLPLLLAASLLGSTLLLAPAVMRYAAEWSSWWVMAGILMAVQIRRELQQAAWPRAADTFDLALIAATIWSCWAAFSFLLTAIP